MLAKRLCQLPLSLQMRVGRTMGRLLYWIPNKRKKIAHANIKHCFSTLDAAEQTELLKANMVATGQGVFEMMSALWAPEKYVANRFEIKGLGRLKQMLAEGKGCLLLSCHTTSIEWGIRGLNHALKAANLPVGHMMARANNNTQLEAHFVVARKKFVDQLIDKKDVRTLLKSIKSGHGVYYAPDQNFSYQCEFISFFERPAATATAPAKLTQSANIKAVPWFCFRTGPAQWVVEICPELPSMGSSDYSQALTEMNQLFEEKIRQYPEQYLWVHRRFKNQPEGVEGIY